MAMRVRIKKRLECAGALGKQIGPKQFIGGQSWVPVLWDGGIRPFWHEANNLEVEVTKEITTKAWVNAVDQGRPSDDHAPLYAMFIPR
ncbi:hypothetical protein LCGC14_1487200 [marine sediment metagenome]|uniref:Uncharacterized protein n=1 Tax=marine sediment metagenome TaxID=412755 RepID=A0A0F9J7U2_9ZZZZ